MRASGIRLAEAIPVLEQAMGCTIEAEKKIGEQPLECDIGLRSPDRLFLGVTRKMNTAFRITYLFRPLRRGEMERVQGAAFTGQIVKFKPIEEQVEVKEIGRRLGLQFRLEGDGNSKVKVWSVDRPLVRLLESIASQTRTRWSVVLHFEDTDRHNLGKDALAYDTAQRHFSELTRLSPEDGQQEIASQVEALRGLEGEQRVTALHGLEESIAELSQLYRGVPGEHRDDVRGLFFGFGQGYYQALGRLPDTGGSPYRSLYEKLSELERLIGTAR